MEGFAQFVVGKRKFFLGIFIILTVLSITWIPQVRVNYDNTKYLPEDMESKKAISIMEREFGLNGYAEVMISGIDIAQAQRLKREIRGISGVKTVVWLDDVADIICPLEFLDDEVVVRYYKDSNALFQVNFEEDDYNFKTGKALDEIRALIPNTISITGPAMSAHSMRTIVSSEILKIILMVVPVLLLILFIATNSWFEPVLFVAVIGVSVLINMGTNIFLGEVSYITHATASLLQLAIAMDYSIFLLHRFGEERKRRLNAVAAMTAALKHSLSTIVSSSFTTLAGFIALMFMRYRIGYDIGLVLAKGIILSLLSVLFLMPALIILTEKLVARTRHGSFLASLKGFAGITFKLRHVIPIAFVLVLVPAFLAQSANNFLYGESAVVAGEGTSLAEEKEKIERVFGINNRIVLLVPEGDVARERLLVQSLSGIPRVTSVMATVSFTESAIPKEVLPPVLIQDLESENYTRMVISVDAQTETLPSYNAVEEIRNMAETHYPDESVLLGSAASISDIKTVVESDSVIVNLFSVLAVGLILLITFKSISIPVILVFVIQSSIWINMSIPYFTGSPLVFMGYMIVGAIQLGATIDYAILLTGRYKDNRATMEKTQALSKAVEDAGHPIITSASILSVAGFILGFMSTIPVISAFGILIGRGALLSGLMVLVLLPQFLALFDGVICRTTLGSRFVQRAGLKGDT